MEKVLLSPGKFAIGDHRCRIQMLLGSGVVVALWHRHRRVGAMAHFLAAADGAETPLMLDGQTAEDGLQRILQELLRQQVDADDCVARICGMGEVTTRADRVPSLNGGQSGGEFARHMVRVCGIPIVSEKFYTACRQQLVFNIGTGRMQARHIKLAGAVIAASPKISVTPASRTRPNGLLRSA